MAAACFRARLAGGPSAIETGGNRFGAADPSSLSACWSGADSRTTLLVMKILPGSLGLVAGGALLLLASGGPLLLFYWASVALSLLLVHGLWIMTAVAVPYSGDGDLANRSALAAAQLALPLVHVLGLAADERLVGL